jgi:transposase-like protein
MERRLLRPVSRSILNCWVDQVGAKAMTPLQLSVALTPTWGGFLGVDGKAVFVKGVEHALLVAVDQTTQDVVHALVVKAETSEAFYRLVREAVVAARYPLSGLIIDASGSFVFAHHDYLARLPVQLCRIHFCRNLDHEIAKAKRSPDAERRAELKQRIRATLFAATYAEAQLRLQQLLTDAAHYQDLSRHDTLGQLEKRFEQLMTHHHHPGLPPDSNITENVIKQLGKKLGLIEGFQTVESAERFTRLLIACYRFKRFTDSANGHNGKAPLELAGVDLAGLDWLTYLHRNQT